MQPEICAYISDTIYDHRLFSQPESATNRNNFPGLCGSGLRYIPVIHSDNSRESPDEAERVAIEIEHLVQGMFVRKNEGVAPISQRDIMVVAPYNTQRKHVETTLDRVPGRGV